MAKYLTAYQARDAAGCAAIYAPETAVFSPFGPPIEGRDSIAEAHEGWFALGEENKRIEVIDCAASGNVGYCLLTSSADIPGDDGTVQPDSGTNLCAMVRRSGVWQILHSSINESLPR